MDGAQNRLYTTWFVSKLLTSLIVHFNRCLVPEIQVLSDWKVHAELKTEESQTTPSNPNTPARRIRLPRIVIILTAPVTRSRDHAIGMSNSMENHKRDGFWYCIN